MKWSTLPAFCLIVLAGCSRLHEERTFTLNTGEANHVKISAPISEQKIKVSLMADAPVSVWIVLEKDVPSGKDDFDPEIMKTGLLASQKETQETTLTATIPAKENYWVVINRASKSSNVTLKIDSQ